MPSNIPSFLARWHESSCRNRLQDKDIDFINKVLANIELSKDKLQARTVQIDSILDNPKLTDYIIHAPQHLDISIELYFYLLIRKSLIQNNIQDTNLTEYLTALMLNKLSSSSAFNTDIPPLYLTDIFEKINNANPTDQFFLRTELANESLFLTGIFFEYLQYREKRKAAPDLHFYENVGSTQYRFAKQHPLASDYNLQAVFSTLAQSFPVIRRSLNTLSANMISFGDKFI